MYYYTPQYPNQQALVHPQQRHLNTQVNNRSDHEVNTQQVVEALNEAVIGEATAIDFYERLLKAAPNEQHKKDLAHALEDERDHLKLFADLYTVLTGNEPKYKIDKVVFRTYREGLKLAYEDELKAYESYRNSYLLTKDLRVRDTFFRAFTDEIEHAIRFGFLLSKSRR
ncbi:ferritin family protein [Bacillus sp. SCS-151]|uniref:ferritin family protein n=1 Tax=Nanhaiella sioensis TaxID=3115293 RepID=UPI00397C4C4A